MATKTKKQNTTYTRYKNKQTQKNLTYR